MKTILEIGGIAVIPFLISYLMIPRIIRWAKTNGNLVAANPRSSHQIPTPSMGGVGVFMGFLMVLPWISWNFQLWLLLLGLMIMCCTGLIDDLKDMRALSKLIIQIGCAILIYLSGIQITHLHGLFGIEEVPQWISFLLTVGLIVGVTNAFNLIDGINGLLGSLTVINGLLFGFVFYANGLISFAVMAVAASAATLGFLPYNWGKAKIFMGDTGSLFLGFLTSVFMVKSFQLEVANQLHFSLVLIPLMVPVMDTLRLFATRIWQRKSPMEADKNHLHHWVVEVTTNHTKATLLITAFQSILIVLVYGMNHLGQGKVIQDFLMVKIGCFIFFLGLFLGVKTFRNFRQLRSHTKLLTLNNKLLEKLPS